MKVMNIFLAKQRIVMNIIKYGNNYNKIVMIKKVEVKTFAEKLYYDECGEEMKLYETGLVTNLTYPTSYMYQCSNCGHIENTYIQYPHICYEIIDDKE